MYIIYTSEYGRMRVRKRVGSLVHVQAKYAHLRTHQYEDYVSSDWMNLVITRMPLRCIQLNRHKR